MHIIMNVHMVTILTILLLFVGIKLIVARSPKWPSELLFRMQRNTHIMGNNLIPISVPIHFVDGSYMYI